MKVLVVGGGGREHAICYKLAQSQLVSKLYCSPGNGGISQVATCLDVKAEDVLAMVDLAQELAVDMVVVGPEVPLAMGIVDLLEERGIMAFGPDKSCARLEASKGFTKEFLQRHQIPTAKYKEYQNIDEIKGDIGIYGYPMVIKADGLAAGKGVVLAENQEEAATAIDQIMGDKVFGQAGDKVIVEECLIGTEASVLCFVDENTIVPMESAQDYKRILDQDKGLNTGGMGAYSPSLLFTPELEEEIRVKILEPTLAGFQRDGLRFKGVLFIGLMLTEEGPKVIEFNNRFGDPETQAVLPRMENDLMEVMLAVCQNRLGEITLKWKQEKSICIIMAAGGYPGTYEKSNEITGIDQVECQVFHSGTKATSDGKILTDGGRVLGVMAMGQTHQAAREKAYQEVKKIHFKDMQYRGDIGLINK